ncbi:hypothetical protein FDENT_8603 [Fusarium denticulatum]|uniref:2EXR domain-containing protein n=1 Tax=Fusarium denticulatum TaxID=48507 RepID=A0A8H5U368_9HYPO|nr:hypothetical protein FDENT_8603 [Fusarium denticulatum]
MPFQYLAFIPTSAPDLSLPRIKTDKLLVMAPSTFHFFTQLPRELRLQIWESAIEIRQQTLTTLQHGTGIVLTWQIQCQRLQKKQSYGINYVSLDNAGDCIPLDCSWNKPHPANRSAYLWHAGLWMAYKESREVMRKHWFNDPYSKSHPEYVEETVNGGLWKWFHGNEEGVGGVDVNWDEWGRELESYEPWLVTISPGDMFCITPDNYRPLSRFKLFLKRSNLKIYEYAVEFDTAWTSELAGLDKYLPTDHLSPTLAFSIRIFRLATQQMSLPSVIHVIDRYSSWKNVSKAEELSVYYDCEHEKIQIDPSNPLATNRLVRSAPMLRFLDQVDRLLKHRLTWKRKKSPWAWGDYGLPPDGLSVRKLARVMATRDKEVVLKATKCNAIPPKMKQPALLTSSNVLETRKRKAGCTMETVV